ncbi:MAG: tyrosine-type recombinase/integrase [Candidatus Omnitrophica bacterium]|nr:tyrosine-type recombinase/integrase [Candidatus Omnitrophota bacterium]
MAIYKEGVCPVCRRFYRVTEEQKPTECSKCQGKLVVGEEWVIDYRVNGRRVRETVSSSRQLAETVFQKRKVEIAENRFLDIKREQRVRFDSFADEYVEVYLKHNSRSWKKADLHNIKRLKRFFSAKHLHEITPFLVEQFKNKTSREVSPASTNRALTRLKAIFNKAIAWKKFNGDNPVKSVKFFKEDNARLRFLEKEEICKLIKNCSKTLRAIVIVALNTGMRKSEILNLKWHDIDFKRGNIYLLKTKNGEKREIPMNEEVKGVLIKVRKHPDSPYIFPNEFGKPFTNIRKSFFTACKKSNIINFRFHDLRHTFASQLVMCGVDLNTVRELLGHKSLEMTLRYSHLSPEHKKRAVDVLASQMDRIWTEQPKEAVVEEPVQDTTVLDKRTYNNLVLSPSQ